MSRSSAQTIEMLYLRYRESDISFLKRRKQTMLTMKKADYEKILSHAKEKPSYRSVCLHGHWLPVPGGLVLSKQTNRFRNNYFLQSSTHNAPYTDNLFPAADSYRCRLCHSRLRHMHIFLYLHYNDTRDTVLHHRHHPRSV